MNQRPTIAQEKKDLRQNAKIELTAIFQTRKKTASYAALRNMLSVIGDFRFEKVGLYAADDTEMPTKELFESLVSLGKKVCFPRIVDDELVFFRVRRWEELCPQQHRLLAPYFGEAMRAVDLDALVVPGRAFDYFGGRLGRGGGYYDRLLNHRHRPKLAIGYAFDVQLLAKKLPCHEHDRKVDMVITEKRIVRT